MSKKNYIIPIFVPHKGCPHNCIFCNQKTITGQKHKQDMKDIEIKIESYLKTFNNSDKFIEIAFYGGSFTAIPNSEQNNYLSIANKYLEKGLIHSIRLSTRPDYIDKRILDNLKEYGVSTIELGVQSLNSEVLQVSNRGHSTDDVFNAAKLIKQEGFTLGIQLMIGLPQDTESRAIETVKKVIELKPEIARIYPALVVRDTYMEKMYRCGEYKPLELKEAVDLSKRLLISLEQNNIKVIRIGLQATEELQAGKDVIAGPYHPAFRQLVETEIFKDMIVFLIKSLNKTNLKEIKILFNHRDYSYVIGQNKSNISFLKKEYPNVKIALSLDQSMIRGDIGIEVNDTKLFLPRKDYYKNIQIL